MSELFWLTEAQFARLEVFLPKDTRGEEALVLEKNQSTYIPTRVAHRLENKGKSPLQLIEVQSGDYLGEDGIVRLEDVYGRS